MAGESKAAVVAAIGANFAICVIKFLAAFFGGSAAMLSEGVHSAVDTVNDLLLLLGLKRSRKPPDEQHPFGYGNELYFWALIVSCSVLGVGGGVTGLEGILHLLHPEPIQHPLWSYIALGCGLAFDGISLVIALRRFRAQNRNKKFGEAVCETKDPGALMVIFEDTAAVIGETVAALGIFANTQGLVVADGAASLLIGVILTAEAIFLIGQMRDLIVGEGVEDEISRSIRRIASKPGRFSTVLQARTIHFGPETVLVTLDAEFDPQRTAGELMQVIDHIQGEIRNEFPAVQFIYLDPEDPTKQHRRPKAAA